MGIVQGKCKTYEVAMENFKEALRIKQTKLGSDNLDVSSTLFQMACLLDNWTKYEMAIEYYEQAVRIRRSNLGDDLLVSKT